MLHRTSRRVGVDPDRPVHLEREREVAVGPDRHRGARRVTPARVIRPGAHHGGLLGRVQTQDPGGSSPHQRGHLKGDELVDLLRLPTPHDGGGHAAQGALLVGQLLGPDAQAGEPLLAGDDRAAEDEVSAGGDQQLREEPIVEGPYVVQDDQRVGEDAAADVGDRHAAPVEVGRVQADEERVSPGRRVSPAGDGHHDGDQHQPCGGAQMQQPGWRMVPVDQQAEPGSEHDRPRGDYEHPRQMRVRDAGQNRESGDAETAQRPESGVDKARDPPFFGLDGREHGQASPPRPLERGALEH